MCCLRHPLRDQNGYGALALAAMRGHTEVVDMLLSPPGPRRADTNARTNSGKTALMLAAAAGHAAVCARLLSAPGLDPNAAELEFGRTALHLAALHGHTGAAEALVGAAAVAATAAKGATQQPTVERDVGDATSQLGVEEDGVDEDGVASVADVVEEDVEAAGLDVNVTDVAGCTPLVVAADSGHADIVSALVAAPLCDVNTQSTNGTSALMAAASRGHASVVEALLRANEPQGDGTGQRVRCHIDDRSSSVRHRVAMIDIASLTPAH